MQVFSPDWACVLLRGWRFAGRDFKDKELASYGIHLDYPTGTCIFASAPDLTTIRVCRFMQLCPCVQQQFLSIASITHSAHSINDISISVQRSNGLAALGKVCISQPRSPLAR